MYFYNNTELYHHGIKGQKWGVRRFKNDDGTLTPAGKLRYRADDDGNYVKRTRKERKQAKKDYSEKIRKEQNKFVYWKKKGNIEKAKKAVEQMSIFEDIVNELPKHRTITWKDGTPYFSGLTKRGVAYKNKTRLSTPT